MMDSGDDRVTLLKNTYRVANKSHKCSECRREISSGEKYYYETYKFDFEFYTHKTCDHCMVVRDWLLDECGGFLYGQIEEDVREYVSCGNYAFDLYRAVVGMSKQWRTKSGKLIPIPNPIQTTDDILAAKGK